MFFLLTEFQSDVFLNLEAVGATLVIKGTNGKSIEYVHHFRNNFIYPLKYSNFRYLKMVFKISLRFRYTPTDWLKISMDRKILYQIKFPKLNNKEYTYASYKITPRRVNAHAYVNVATKFRTDKNCVVK